MNILDFGAKRGEFCGDAIQRAIDAAAAQGASLCRRANMRRPASF